MAGARHYGTAYTPNKVKFNALDKRIAVKHVIAGG